MILNGPDKLVYDPSPWGIKFHARTEDWVLGGGAAGPGKSTCLRADPIPQIWVEHQRMLGNHPLPIQRGQSKGRALLLRRELKMLGDSIQGVREIANAMDPDYHWNGEDLVATFKSGFRYQLGHCKDFNDWERYHGEQFTWLGIDELTQFDEEPVTHIGLRVRTADPILAPMMRKRAMTNPLLRRESGDAWSVKDPQWVRKRFVDPHPEGGVVIPYRSFWKGKEYEETCVFLPATIEHNPDPDFRDRARAELAKMKPWLRKALGEGNWYVSPGSFFSEWDQGRHVCRPFRIPDDWPIWRSMDWGYQTQGAIHWYAKHPDGAVFVVYELSFRKMKVPAVAQACRNIEERLGVWGKARGDRSQITGPADTQLWEARGDMGMSKAEEFIKSGMNWLPANKGPGSRQSGAERISQMLAESSEDQLLFIFSCCPNLIRTLPGIPTDPDNSAQPLDGGEDHWVDSLRYGLDFASRGVPKRRRKDEDDEERPLRTGDGSSSFGYWT